MQRKTFNWGIIAPGRIARRFAEGLSAIEDAKLYAVASSNEQRGKAFAKDFGAATSYLRYDELLADPKVDAVYIANPHRFHYETIRACILAGKPVLCEKPLTVNAAQAEQLMALAEQHQVFLMEAMWSRYLPVWQQVKRWLNQNMIGDIKLLQSSFAFPIPRDESDRLLNVDLAGGVLLDYGVYNVALSQFVMGRHPSKVLADGLVGPTGVDERCSVILNYGGAVSQFTCSFQSYTENSFCIYGDKGKIVVPAYFWDSNKVELHLFDKPPELLELPYLASGFEYQASEAMSCIRQGGLQSQLNTWQDTLGTQRVMDEILAQVGVSYPFL